MRDVVILYASISGRTRKVASEIVDEFLPLKAEAFDLRNGLDGVNKCKLMIFGSPTYGTGEWHHLWEKLSPRLADIDLEWSSQLVAVFALGDAQHHPESFAGALARLRNFVARLDAQLIGETEFHESYNLQSCGDLLTSGTFPGLVLDQVKQRKLGTERIRRWVTKLKDELKSSLPSCSQNNAQRLQDKRT